ncbi:methyltransferase domain-containing protein [Nocardioides ferulae]|uniref:methyltransferase domain-containing protein n=1 Tax=Nocardioides ferulae TaxID=2340821 RepID=UPI000EB146DA|nr:methyltransferase domain-containing protein [Nocardioides ferulae]
MITGDGPPEAPEAVVERVRVDDRGIHLRAAHDRVVDFLFDGRRIGSFWLLRDTVADGADRLFAWPTALVPYLRGATRVALVDHLSERQVHDVEVVLGEGGDDRIRVEDGNGNPLGLDKSQRLMRLFDSRDRRQLDPLLDAIEAVVAELEACGLEPFLAYGTLLGAVRDGQLIGYDSDADLGYVSRFDHPVDVARESFRVQRALVERGYRITRYSGLAFKIVIEEADGARRGLDVFGGFRRDGVLYLMGEVGHRFRDEWLWPRGETTLAGRRLPAPAQPEHLLEAMYGPHWRVPDPAFKFSTPRTAQRRLNGWFRGTRVGREEVWDRHYHRGGAAPRKNPTPFVRWVRAREPELGTAVDLGCGTGRDVLWLAQQGVEAWGLDFVARAFRTAERRAGAKGLPAHFLWTNLTELRSVLVAGALLSRRPGPRVVLARHVADATNEHGRENLIRLARMVTRGSGRLYLQVTSGPADGPADGPGAAAGELGVHPIDLERFEAQVARLGGRVVERVEVGAGAAPTTDAGSRRAQTHPQTSRLVIEWNP